MAINRKQIAAAHLGAVPTASLFPPTTQGYDSALNSQYAYNPAKAKQLLAQAGYGSGFSFTVVTVGPQFAVDLQAIQAEWQQIGVNMTIQQATSFAQGLQSQATTPIGFNDLTVGRDPLGFVNGFLLGGSLNAQHAVDPKILKDLGIAESGTGDSDVTALKALDSTIINDGWFIPVYTQPTYIGYNPAVLAAPVSTGTNVYPQLPTPRS
jgi:peptide/nickel transport system substrate-binding protein